MNSATKVILEKGFEKTTMEDIIAGTSLSKGEFTTIMEVSLKFLKIL